MATENTTISATRAALDQTAAKKIDNTPQCPLGKGHFAVMEASSRVTDAKTIVAADTVIIVS
jgi:hypothetical protein